MEKVVIYSPATVANLACGYDIMGLALNNPGDEMVVTRNHSNHLVIKNLTPYSLPEDPKKNTATVAVQSLLDALGANDGFNFEIRTKIKPGSGLGSSASSAAAAVYGVNKLLGEPLSTKELVVHAMEGEKYLSAKAHADNVAPALLGGVILIRGYDPLDIIQLEYPEDLYLTIIHPQISIKTSEARRLLGDSIAIDKAVAQWGNVGGLVAGFLMKNHSMIGNSLKDHFAEPVRSSLIPYYNEVKSLALENEALGFNISGSGPAMFAFSTSAERAELIKIKCLEFYSKQGIDTLGYVSSINTKGTQLIEK